MKILQIATFKVGACGPTAVLTPIISRLNKKGHTVDVFSTGEFDQDKQNLLDSLGAKYYYKKSKSYITKSNFLKIIPNIKEYDIVHIHGVFNLDNIKISRILSKLNIPYIVSTHGNLMEHAINHGKLKKKIAIELLIKKMLKKALYIHALAEEEKKDLKKIIDNLDNIIIIHNGIESVKNMHTSRNDIDNIVKILFIGRLDIHHKGLDLLLDAIEANPQWNEKLCVYLVGPFDSQEDEFIINKRLENNRILNQIIKIEGPKYGEEKYKYYNECDLFIHTSRYEGMPMSVLEAMQFGMPCIITNQTNMASIIRKSNGGLVLDCSVDDIIQNINKILDMDKKELHEMGENSYRWSNKNLNWDKISLKYEEMYNN